MTWRDKNATFLPPKTHGASVSSSLYFRLSTCHVFQVHMNPVKDTKQLILLHWNILSICFEIYFLVHSLLSMVTAILITFRLDKSPSKSASDGTLLSLGFSLALFLSLALCDCNFHF